MAELMIKLLDGSTDQWMEGADEEIFYMKTRKAPN